MLMPLLAAHGALLGALDDDVGWHFPAVAWGWVRSGRLVTSGVLGGGTVQLLSGVLGGVGQHLKRSRQWHIARTTTRHPSHWPPRVMIVLPPFIGLIVTQVPHAPFWLHAYVTGPSAH
jgi:hypothetical protein